MNNQLSLYERSDDGGKTWVDVSAERALELVSRHWIHPLEIMKQIDTGVIAKHKNFQIQRKDMQRD